MALPRKRGAIVFTDIRDFTRRMSESEALGMKLMKIHNDVMDRAAKDEGGTVVKSIGDSYLIVFEDLPSAVRCALWAQERFADANRAKPQSERVDVRMSIHIGEVLIKGEDIFGSEVNLASRILGITPAGRIFVSKVVFEELNGRIAQTFSAVGLQQFKGFPQPIEVFELVHEDWKTPSSISTSSSSDWAAQAAKEAALVEEAPVPKRRRPVLPIVAALIGMAALLWLGSRAMVAFKDFDWSNMRWRAVRRVEQIRLGMAPSEVSSILGAPELHTTQAGTGMWFYGIYDLRKEPGEFGATRSAFKADITVIFKGRRVSEIALSPDREWLISSSDKDAPLETD